VTWENRIVGSGMSRAGDLLANEKNWRIHGKSQQDALSAVLGNVGWVAQIIVNKRSDPSWGNKQGIETVVDGHLRVELALSQGEDTEVPVTYVDLSEQEEGLILASFDPIAAMAAADREQLGELLKGIESEDAAIKQMLESIAQENKIPFGIKEGLTDDDEIPEEVEPTCKTGDLWQLGNHWLLCGDATKREDVERLMQGEKAGLLLTDPPYNVGLEYTEATNDRREDYEGWTRVWFGLASQIAMKSIITPGCINLGLWLRLFEPYHVGVWYKGMGATTHGRVTKYWSWEPLMFHGDQWPRIRHIDLFEYPGWGTMIDHPCPKPIGLWCDLIENYTETKALVLDLFGGSGTTLIACEKLGRKCRMLEIDPHYNDVIIQRWQNYTGKQAVKL